MVLQIYDCPESELKLNEVFEFVGVFTMDQEDNDESIDGIFEDELVSFPVNKVLGPCLSCKIFSQRFSYFLSPICVTHFVYFEDQKYMSCVYLEFHYEHDQVT